VDIAIRLRMAKCRLFGLGGFGLVLVGPVLVGLVLVPVVLIAVGILPLTTPVGASPARELVSVRVLGALGGSGDVQAKTRVCGADVTGAGPARLRGVGVGCAARAQGEGDDSEERRGVKTAHIAC